MFIPMKQLHLTHRSYFGLRFFGGVLKRVETSVPLEPGRDHGPFVISSDLLNDIYSSYFIIIIIIQTVEH